MCCNQLNRRDFLELTTGLIAGVSVSRGSVAWSDDNAAWDSDEWDPTRPLIVPGKALRVQPVHFPDGVPQGLLGTVRVAV